MGVVQGRDILIYSGSSGTTPIIAGAKACTISEKADVQERSSASSQTAREYVAGRTEWDVSINHLVTSGAEFEGIMKVGNTYQLSIVINGVRKIGKAICVSAEAGGAVGSLSTGSVKFKGTGELTAPPSN